VAQCRRLWVSPHEHYCWRRHWWWHWCCWRRRQRRWPFEDAAFTPLSCRRLSRGVRAFWVSEQAVGDGEHLSECLTLNLVFILLFSPTHTCDVLSVGKGTPGTSWYLHTSNTMRRPAACLPATPPNTKRGGKTPPIAVAQRGCRRRTGGPLSASLTPRCPSLPHGGGHTNTAAMQVAPGLNSQAPGRRCPQLQREQQQPALVVSKGAQREPLPVAI